MLADSAKKVQASFGGTNRQLLELQQDNTILQFAECETLEINENRKSEPTMTGRCFQMPRKQRSIEEEILRFPNL
jgi:hypothetical protein